MINIPEDKLPQEWKDETRLNSLFSPFRNRNVNPRDWETKLSSWKNIIQIYCINNQAYSFTLSDLSSNFQRNGRPPSGLPIIVKELINSGDIQPIESFLKKSPTTWSGWATDLLVKKPLGWSYTTLRRSLFSDDVNPAQTYVHLQAIEVEANKLSSTLSSKFDNKIINYTKLLELAGDASSNNLKLLVHYLITNGKISVKQLKENEPNDSNSFLIKFAALKPTPITELEVSKYVLEQDEELFTKHVEELEDEVTNCINQAKAHLAKNHRQLAKSCLRKKHEAGRRLDKKLNALHNIQVLLEKVKDVDTDSNVLESYKLALDAFNKTFKDKGLNEDAVEKTMDQVMDVLDEHNKIQTSLAAPISEDDGDLEAELAELLESHDEPPAPGNNNSGLSGEQVDKLLEQLDLDGIPKSEVTVFEASQI